MLKCSIDNTDNDLIKVLNQRYGIQRLSFESARMHAQSCPAHQAPQSMGFSRQEYWNGLPFPPSEDLPDPGVKHMSSASPALQADSLLLEPSGKLLDLKFSFYFTFGSLKFV